MNRKLIIAATLLAAISVSSPVFAKQGVPEIHITEVREVPHEVILSRAALSQLSTEFPSIRRIDVMVYPAGSGERSLQVFVQTKDWSKERTCRIGNATVYEGLRGLIQSMFVESASGARSEQYPLHEGMPR
jgi:hypothetical protein